MSTKFELIIRITDSEEGVAESKSAVSGDDFDETADRFRDMMYFSGTDITDRALENPDFVKETKAKTTSGKTGGKKKPALGVRKREE
jgi:hypothetical protein